MYSEDEIISMWAADMYDLNETDVTDVDFALSVIGKPSKRILEIACGSGRYLLPLAKSGHKVTGLDFDEFMLKKLEAKLESRENIEWRKADVIRDEWGDGFDVVLLAANFLFNIVSDMKSEKAQELLVKKSAGSLLSGGHLFIDYGYTLYPEKWYDTPDPIIVWEGTDCLGNIGKMSLLNNRFDKSSGMCGFIRRYEITLGNGQSIVRDIPAQKHFVSLGQIQEWLLNAGFVMEGVWGDYERNPIGEDTDRAIIWARKI